MKKSLTLFLCLFIGTFFFSKTISQSTVFDLKEDFTTDVANWGFALSSGGTQTITYNSTEKSLQIRWANSSSEFIKSLETSIEPGTDGKLTAEFIINAHTSGNASNFGAIYLLDDAGKAITGFHVRRGKVNGVNKWFVGRATIYLGVGSGYPDSADPLDENEPLARITFELDFSTKMITKFIAEAGTFDYTTRIFTPGSKRVENTVGAAFINTEASNLKSLSSWYYRAGSAGGTNGLDFMYAAVSAQRDIQVANVTVKFMDQNNVSFKDDEVISNQAVGSTYQADILQKSSVSKDGFYYVLDPSSPTSVIVNAAGSTLELRFRKSALNSDLTWNGTSDENGDLWSEWYLNFLNSSSSASAYQSGANVIFNASAVNKDVLLNQTMMLGNGNIQISSDEYTFNGIGSISGTGRLDVNPGATGYTLFNITNNQSGGVNLLSGTLEVGKAEAGSSFNLSNNTRLNLNPDANFSKPISGTGSITINTIANRFYESTVTGASTVNLILGVSGALTGGVNWSSKVTSLMPADAQVNVTTTETSAGYGVQSLSLQNSKLNLGANVRLLHNYNPTEGGTTIYVGELSGDAASTVEGGWVASGTRNLNYEIGSLNTDASFHGTFKNYGSITAAPLNIIKQPPS